MQEKKINIEFPVGLIHQLRSTKRVVVLTGAGISAESGVPTFRDAQSGLWARYRPVDLATPQAFMENPRLVWEWYTWRRTIIENVSPNPGHLALAEMEKHIPEFTLITQNVDGLHHRAGSGINSPIVELHGNIFRTRCFSEGNLVDSWENQENIPPLCPHCSGLLRPDLVWFGENLSADIIDSALNASETCDLFLSIGTSGIVEPAASLPYAARNHGATLVEINPLDTSLTNSAMYVLRGPAGQVLPQLVLEVWGRSGV
ncbi:NAD-dependent deacylase [Chloroflexota bacterium]